MNLQRICTSVVTVFFYLSDDDRFLLLLLAVALFFGIFFLLNRRAKQLLEQDVGKDEGKEFQSNLDWLLRNVKPKPSTVLKYSEQEFQEMVANAMDEVPEEFDQEWKNVAVIVSTDWPSDADKKRMGVKEGNVVFGTYSGGSRMKGAWASTGAGHVVTIYQPALELCYGADKAQLEQEIRRVVLHELAHHLGMSHPQMKKIGL
jgi:predicted Zn-dependent protease with MMP-like domain